MGENEQRHRRRAGLRDLLLISLPIVALLWVGAAIDLFETAYQWLRDNVGGAEDEILFGLLFAVLGLLAFAVLRWRVERQEFEARTTAESKYRALVEKMPAVLYTWDPRKRAGKASTPYVSPQVEAILGFTVEEWRGDPELWIRQIHPDDRDGVLAASSRADRTGEPLAIEYRHLRKDGQVVWIRDEAVVVERDRRGRPSLAQGFMYDITARRHAEEQLLEAQERFRALVEQIPAVVYVEELETGRNVYISPQIEPMFGYTPEEWVADRSLWERRLHPDDRERVLAENEEESGDRWSIEHRTLHRDGRTVWIQNEAVLVRDHEGRPLFWQGVVFDITARKEAEEQVRVAEERYRTLVEAISAVIYIDRVDQELTTVYVSPQIETLFGYTVEDWIRDAGLWARNLHPDDAERALEAARVHNMEGSPLDLEYRLRAGDGTWRWVRDLATIVRDECGAPALSQGLMSDITALKEAQEQLRETEAKYRAIVEHVPAAIYVDRPDGSMDSVYVSPQIEEILGVSPQMYLDNPELWLELIDDDAREEIRRTYLEAISARQPWVGEYPVHTPDGREVWVHDETTFVVDEQGHPMFVQGVLYDVTERKLAEHALRESERREREAAERLRALDEMKNTFLAAVSHELRSPLTSILGLSLTLEQTRLPEEDQTDLLGRLATNARKLDRMLKDLLDIDRLNRGIVTPNYRPTDVGALVRRTVESLDLLGVRPILVEAEPVTIQADPAKVERIVENLLANAARHTGPDTRIWIRVWAEPDGPVLAVEDDGPGVPKELQHAIFEPFRQGPTASPHSPGTGIGLSLVAMFAELHGGRAWVQDREGGGASFRVFLPSTPAAQSAVEAPIGMSEAG